MEIVRWRFSANPRFEPLSFLQLIRDRGHIIPDRVRAAFYYIEPTDLHHPHVLRGRGRRPRCPRELRFHREILSCVLRIQCVM